MRPDHKKRNARLAPGGCVETKYHEDDANASTPAVGTSNETSSTHTPCYNCGEPIARAFADTFLQLRMACRIERLISKPPTDPHVRLVAELAVRIGDLLDLCSPFIRKNEIEFEFACEVSDWLLDVRRRILKGG